MNQTNRFWLTIHVLLALCLSVCLSACEMPPAGSTQAKLEIDPTVNPDTEGIAGADAVKPTADSPVGALIHRIDLPLEVSLEPCWATVNESAVPMLKRGMWQINGLRIGVLDAENATLFAQGLPSIHGESRAKLLGSPHPSSVRSTPRLIQPVVVDLTDPPKSPKVLRLKGGKLQLLAKITRDETGQAYLELTPHHYKPKADLVPRSPLEKQLDGHVFTELTTKLALTRNTAVVVGLYRPWLEPVDLRVPQGPSETGATEGSAKTPEDGRDTLEAEQAADPDQDTTQDAKDAEPEQPEIPNHLGKALMAGQRAGHDTQVIMVISLMDDWD